MGNETTVEKRRTTSVKTLKSVQTAELDLTLESRKDMPSDVKNQEALTNGKIIEILNTYLNLDSRVGFLENLLNREEDAKSIVNRSIKNNQNEKCKSIYSKSELAHLFYFLMEERILFFDLIDERRNRSKLQDFLVKNFTYSGDEGFQVTMNSISKQFSECKGFSYRDKHIKFLEELINRIQQQKEQLINW